MFGVVGSYREQCVLSRFCPVVRKVENRSFVLTCDSGVWLGHEVADICGVPVIATRFAGCVVQTLLHHSPFARAGHDKRVQINLKSVGDGVVVDASGKAAGADQFFPIPALLVRQQAKFGGRVTRVTTATSADVNTEFVRAGIEATLEGSHDRRCDARGVPIHAHNGTEGLKPERITEAGEELGGAVMVDYCFRDGGTELLHALGKPRRHASAVERKVGVTGTFHYLNGRMRAAMDGVMERTDLVCGMTVDEEQPRFTTEYDGKSYAFCSAECKRQFDDHPDGYIRAKARERLGI